MLNICVFKTELQKMTDGNYTTASFVLENTNLLLKRLKEISICGASICESSITPENILVNVSGIFLRVPVIDRLDWSGLDNQRGAS